MTPVGRYRPPTHPVNCLLPRCGIRPGASSKLDFAVYKVKPVPTEDHPEARWKTSDTLVPPKPKELLITASTRASRAV